MGISRWHGGHQVAQRFSTVGLPLKSASDEMPPSLVATSVALRRGASPGVTARATEPARNATLDVASARIMGLRSTGLALVRDSSTSHATTMPASAVQPPSRTSRMSNGDAKYAVWYCQT